jgi:long-chain fatty acid transport protein
MFSIRQLIIATILLYIYLLIKKNNMKKIIVTSLTCIVSLQALAGGYKIALQGQKAIGMAHTGVGLCLDASSIYFNPGALVHNGNQITFGVTGLVPRVQFVETNTQTKINAVNKTYTPLSLYASYKINPKLAVGLGVYTPFGSGVKYPSGWLGRFILTEINLTAINIQPTVSYKLNKEFSIGAGLVVSTGHVTLGKDIAALGSTGYASGFLEGRATGLGYNIGGFYKKNKFSAGLTYHSLVTLGVKDGDATFINVPTLAAASFPASTKFSSNLPLPSELALGVGYQATAKLLVAADLNYTFWNVFDSLSFTYTDKVNGSNYSSSARKYKNAMALRVGAQYMYSKKLHLRAGAFTDATPVQDGYVNPELPDANKFGLTCGFSYVASSRVTIDGSFLYEGVNKRTQTNIETELAGTFQSKIVAPGIGISYNFGAPKKVFKAPTKQ